MVRLDLRRLIAVASMAALAATGVACVPPTPAPPSPARAVSAGLRHTCAAMVNGSVRCWGSNEWGQVGDGTTTDRLTPRKVKGVAARPTFHYNPDLFWDADPGHSKAKIPPGPNNPVGVVWIGLSKEHYGIHGTPEPGTIGHTQSHGCIRLTNWDATELASMVKPGLKVVLQEP